MVTQNVPVVVQIVPLPRPQGVVHEEVSFRRLWLPGVVGIEAFPLFHFITHHDFVFLVLLVLSDELVEFFPLRSLKEAHLKHTGVRGGLVWFIGI